MILAMMSIVCLSLRARMVASLDCGYGNLFDQVSIC